MFQESALEAVKMLILLFWIVLAFIVVWVGCPTRGDRRKRVTLKKEKDSCSGRYTIFHALFEALKEKDN